jgi:hypothetical protein
LNFDLTAIPTHADVTKAEISFYRTGDYLGYDMDGTYEVYLITKSWASSTATWENLATSIGQTPVTTLAYHRGTTGWFDFDVTDAAGDLVSDPSKNYGFMILIEFELNAYTNGHISLIHSSEATREDLQPKMVIDYTATPVITGRTKIKSNNMSISYKQSGALLVNTKSDGIYTILFYTGNGRLIDQIDKRYLSAGSHTISCGNVDLPKGVVLITLRKDNQSAVSKAVIY